MGKLKEKMRMDMELKNFSIRTIDTYLACVKGFVVHYKRSPELLGYEQIRGYLYYLLKEKKASQSTINQTYSALKFLYEVTLRGDWNSFKIPRCKVAKTLPVVLSTQEVNSVFSMTRNLKHRAVLMTIYSGGLRLHEAAQFNLIISGITLRSTPYTIFIVSHTSRNSKVKINWRFRSSRRPKVIDITLS